MKRSLPLYILLTFLSIGLFASSWQGSVSEMLFSTILVKTEKEEIDNRVIDSELVFQRKISKKTVNHLQYQGLSVIIPEYTLSKDLRVSIFSIKENEHQPLPMGLVNVTRGVFGYRILPQNITLKKEIQIAIDFDENKIPEGYTRADVEVFALDTYSKQWRKLKKDKLEVGTGTIKARANGFSDFITGVIKQPESPDTTGFTPTTITGLKATEPFVGIENISVSAPNSQGVASATFPILLPKGRGGLEPHLQISYQQDNGQTWLGTGWDLSLSSINIDTKWGSPRYDADKETETYLFSGEELLPNAHRNAWEDREEDKAFFPRREGGFSKIIRVGNSPKNYFWKTHSKSGITTYYGNPNAQLSDHNGNIGYWAISKQEDLYGNQITYEYTSEKGILYPKSIYYTGYRGERGNYSVHFFTDKDLGEPQRLDLQTIARLGFKQEHNRLLRKIEVRYKDQPIKSYELLYKTGAYHKTLLKEIVIYDAKEKEFYRHQMEYYDDVRDGEGNYQPFGDFQKWAVPNDNIGYTFLGMDGFSGKATLAGTSNSQTTGGNFRIGVGTLKGRFNEYTLGGSGNYSTGKTQSKVLLQDIDGDNLPDKIYVKDHKVYYRKNISNQGNSHRFSDEIHQLNLPSLGVTQSSSSGFGVDLQLQKAIIGYNRQTSKSTTNSYFMDFNADGLVDFVSGGMVYYNRLVAGIPYFTPNSTGTPVPISISSTELSITGQTSLDKDSLRRNNPLHDVVRSWTAPYDGTLQIQHRYHLIEDLSDQRKNYTKNDGSPKADGVELYFQHHKNLVWKEKINPDDYTEKSKTNTITIKRGETLYFRVSSIYDGNYDRTEWHTDLRYLSISHPIKDINGEDLHLYHTKEDLYSTAQSFVFSEIVKPRLIGTFSKPKTTDKVKLIVLKENLSTETTTIVFEQQFEEGEETEFDLSSIDLGTFQNSESLQLRLVSDTQLHWNSISINPQISYHSELTNKTETAVLAVDYTVFHRQDDLGADYFHTPIEGMLDFGFGALLPKTFKDLSGDITITAKQNGKVLTRKNYTVIGNKQTQIVIITPKGSPIINEQASIDGAISVEIIVRDGQGNSEIVQWMNENKVPIALSVNDNILHQNWMKYWLYEPLEAPYLPTLFGKTYRGWGSFILNGDLAKDLIDENQLKDHQGEYNGSDIHNFNPDNGNGYGMEIANVYFLRTTSITGQRTHTGSESDIFINENHYSPSRLGENDLENYLDTTLPPLAGGVSRALAIVTESKSNAYATGVSASGVGGIGGSYSRGESRVKQTMSDFNGDRFPDFIRGGNVQFTEPKGGISTQYLDIGDFTTSKTETVGGSADGSIRHGTPKNSLSITIGKNKLHANNTATQGKDDAEKAKNSIGVSASQSLGNDYAEHTYTDMNGDGLADRITSSTIQYNIGYGFLPAEPWDFETLSRGSNQDVGAGLGYSLFGGSFRGGLNYSRSISQLKTQFLDVTGDGLADKLVYTDAKTSIFQNLGNRFSNLPIEVSTNQRTAENISISYGGGANFSYEFKLEFIGLRFSITAGAFHGTNANRIEATFIDIDGDGNLDYVLSEDEDDLKVALSNHKRTHLLKSIKNATGSTIELDYEWKAPTYDNPNSQWVLSQITTNDGHEGDGEDTTITAITYQNPYYDRYERMFYGYELLTQKSIHPRDNSTMRTAVQHFYNQDFYTRGLLKSAYTLDETNQKLTETHTEYTSYPLDTNTKKLDLSHPISHQWIAANRLSPNVYSLFTPPVKTTTKTFEGDGFLEHTTLKTYDEYGNLATYIDKGTGDATSEIIADITYHENETPYFGAIPKSIIIKDLKQILRHRTAEIHPQTGAIIQIKQYADVQTPSVTDLSYDAYGNLNEVKNAENYKGERTHLKYQYDEDNHSHIVKITDQFGYENTIEYDYRYNTPTQQTDRNGQTIHYTLDDKGRISSILAPKEAEAGKPYTIAYDYYPSAEVPYAKTKNHDPEHNTDIETYTYADGLGRIVQVKKTASVFKGKNTEDEIKHIISGKQIYDPLGRIIATYYPTTADSSEAYQVVPSLQAPTTVEYDSKDRVILHTFPDQSTLRTSFSIEEKNGIPHLKTTQTDALGRSTSTFTDVLGRQTAMIQANRIETQFQYNALGEILEVKDHDGNTTESTYDLLGRRTKYTHPDAGTLVMVYDKAGNLIKRQTSQIREEMSDAFIEYHYEYTRLKEIKYPKYPDNNVRYHYGTAEETPSRR
ncbi:MAG: SpvB/TcaC N-terminal domain-containing protein, partial [Cruoricaptor ignavus]|nr:SpvB/TcaC N-terminal domain-containing protein [Cruoricaptor ignavus]